MPVVSYGPGDLVVAEGDASDFVLHINEGEAKVTKMIGGQDVLLGTLGEGDYIGEMGVIEGRPRGASVRATNALSAEFFGRDEFLQKVSQDPHLSFSLLRRLSERLNAVNENFAGLSAEQRSQVRMDAIATKISSAHKPFGDHRPKTRLVLRPGSRVLAGSLPSEQIVLDRLPYVVGRKPGSGEPAPSVAADLMLDDAPPYRLSCPHFLIEARLVGYGIRDLGSALGTQVNGMAIGNDFGQDEAPLDPGENEVVAGGEESDYHFKLSIEAV